MDYNIGSMVGPVLHHICALRSGKRQPDVNVDSISLLGMILELTTHVHPQYK